MKIELPTAFVKCLVQRTRGRALLSALLHLVLNGIQGIGLLSILPLLYLSGYGYGKTTDSPLIGIAQAIEDLGFSFTLSNILLAFTMVIVAGSALRRYQSVFNERIQQNFIGDLGLDLVHALNAAPWSLLAKSRHSRITQALSDDLKQIHIATVLSFQLFGGFSLLAINLIVACFISIKLVIPSILAMSIIWALLRPFHKKSNLLGERLRTARERFFDLLATNLSGLKLIRIHSKESLQNDQFTEIRDETVDQANRFRKSHATALWIFESGAAIGLAVFIYASIFWMELPTASLLLLIFIYARSLPLCSRAQQSWHAILHAMPSFAAYQKICQDFQAPDDAMSSQSTDIENFSLAQSIRFENVSFSYGNRLIFDESTFNIAANKTTALIGESGSGKSTLADLISGLISPQSGKIYIDEKELTQENASTWRRQIAYIPQENVLFHTTIRNNFLWSNLHASDTDIESALATANAQSIVKNLPEGLDTIVGERGSLLSGGERQRIALARALVAKPKLLILDEATNALDMENETQVRNAIQSLQGELTVLVIAHDSNVGSMADHIYRIERK